MNDGALSILHVHTLPVMSGSGINTLLTIQGSLARGHQVALACAAGGKLTEAAARGGAAIEIVPRLGRELHAISDVASVSALASLMRSRRYTLVHTHNSKAGFVGRLAARRARVPLVIHTVHGFAFHDAESAARRFLFRQLERLAARWCHGMIFISQPLSDWARRERIGIGVPQRVIYSGIDVDAFRTARGDALRRSLGIASDRLVVGIVSKLWEGKGHTVLLDAWRAVVGDPRLAASPPLLLIVGDGPLEPMLRARVAELGLAGAVCFAGFRDDVPEVTAALDVAVLPSLFEGMGRVVLEAMATGKPVVASRVGGIPDLVRDGQTGMLAPAGDSRALAAVLVEVLVQPELRLRLSEGARRAFRPEYTAARMVGDIHDFYRETASGLDLYEGAPPRF